MNDKNLTRIEDFVELGERAAAIVEHVAGAKAFRKFSWLRAVPLRNSSGNYRGMIVSSQWRTVFEISGHVEDAFEGAEMLLALLHNILMVAPLFEAICRSQDPWGIKSSRLCAQVSAIALKIITTPILMDLHAALTVAKTVRYGVLLATHADLTHPTMTQLFFDFTSARLGTFAETFTNGDQLYHVIRVHVLN